MRAVACLGVVGASALLGAPANAASAATPPSSASSAAASVTKAMVRTKVVVDPATGERHTAQVGVPRTVTLSVDVTTNLREQQILNVNWSGAQPTSDQADDPTRNASVNGANTAEYPMLLMPCRGDAQTITPQTCWNEYVASRGTRDIGVQYPPWRLDSDAAQADRAVHAGEPDSHSGCSATFTASHQLPFVAADGTAYYGSGGGGEAYRPGLYNACGRQPPEAPGTEDAQASFPDPTTYNTTAPDGTGTARFSVRTATSNRSLGCSAVVPCALVAIPIMGINCDGGAGLPADQLPDPSNQDAIDALNQDEQDCELGGASPPGTQSGGQSFNYSVTGRLWWSASNWKNRIVVPLSFAPADNLCDGFSKRAIEVYGSELLVQATTQWAPKFCRDSDPNVAAVKHVQLEEPLARRELDTGQLQAVVTSRPPDQPYSEPVVNVPIGVGGFAISYDIDKGDGEPYHSLKLTPRLLAKLLTQSYLGAVPGNYYPTPAPTPLMPDPKGYMARFAGNPGTLTADPEFLKLNPVAHNAKYGDWGGSTDVLQMIGSQSDVMQALTSYINADPEARAWLNGLPDPWGMIVHPAYLGITLPVQSWNLQDTFTFGDYAASWPPDAGALNPCFLAFPGGLMRNMHMAPAARFLAVRQALQTAHSLGSQCGSAEPDAVTGDILPVLIRDPVQPVGKHFLIGLTPLADAKRYGFDVASLQVGGAKQQGKFPDDRTFVSPDSVSLTAAAKRFEFDPQNVMFTLPYDKLVADPTAANAYPGTMVVYAAVRTNLSPPDETAYAHMATYMLGDGQKPGAEVGQLAAGFAPLTAANGLGGMSALGTWETKLIARGYGESPCAKQDPTTNAWIVAVCPMPVAPPVPPPPPLGVTGPSDVVPASVPSTTPSSAVLPLAIVSPPSATPAATVKPTVGPTRLAGKTEDLSTSFATVALIVMIALLLLGPLAVPVFVFTLRKRQLP